MSHRKSLQLRALCKRTMGQKNGRTVVEVNEAHLTLATFVRDLRAYLYTDPASRTRVTLSPGWSKTIALVDLP